VRTAALAFLYYGALEPRQRFRDPPVAIGLARASHTRRGEAPGARSCHSRCRVNRQLARAGRGRQGLTGAHVQAATIPTMGRNKVGARSRKNNHDRHGNRGFSRSRVSPATPVLTRPPRSYLQDPERREGGRRRGAFEDDTREWRPDPFLACAKRQGRVSDETLALRFLLFCRAWRGRVAGGDPTPRIFRRGEATLRAGMTDGRTRHQSRWAAERSSTTSGAGATPPRWND